MKTQAFVVTPHDYPRALNVIGVTITVLAPNTATDAYEVTLQQGGEGVGPPPHSHAWDESFFVVDGEVEFEHSDRMVQVPAGSFVHLPGGTVHAYRFGRGGGTLLEISGAGKARRRRCSPASTGRFPPGPPDLPKLVDILQKNGVGGELIRCRYDDDQLAGRRQSGWPVKTRLILAGWTGMNVAV